MEQQLTQLTGALLVAVAAFAYLALRAWRNHALEQARVLGDLPPEIAHTEAQTSEGFYVATTIADEPLNRLKAKGLGMRGRAQIEYSKDGVSVWRVGEDALHIPISAVLTVDQATAVIDRAVEAGGLSRISWLSNNSGLDTYLRFANGSEQRKFHAAFAHKANNRHSQGESK